MGDRIESRRLLNRLEYQAVVDAKRNQGAAVIGDRSQTTGNYEASEPDGSKVFGVKIDNSVPDGNAVRSLKGDSGQLYLQGQTADLKPRFGELEEDAIAPKGTPLETIISPLSKGSDSFAAIDIGNKGNTILNAVEPLPSHLGNELGYSRGQIWDSPREGRYSLTWDEFIAYPRNPEVITGLVLRAGEWDESFLAPKFTFPESSVYVMPTDNQTFVFGQAIGKFFTTTRKKVLFRFKAVINHRTADLIIPSILFYVGDPAIESDPDSETTASISAVGSANITLIKSKDGRSITYKNSSTDARGTSPATKTIEDEFYFDFLPGITDLSLRITLEDQPSDPNFYWLLTIIPFPNA